MRKLAIASIAALSLVTFAARPAEASRCGRDCLPWLTPIAVGMGVGLLGVYAYGIGYYAYHDLEGSPKSSAYYGSELIIHGALGSVFTGGAIDAARSGSVGGTLGLGAFAAVHLTLASNGLRGSISRRDEIDIPDTVITWGAGAAVGINALYWASEWPDRHSRGFGAAELAINAPLAVGLGYLAKDRFDHSRGGPGALYGGMALLSGVYAVHGFKTLVAPRTRNKLDLLGTDVVPTVVSDGRDYAPGFGASRVF